MLSNAQWEQIIQDFARHQKELDQQMQDFVTLQNEVQQIVEQAPNSPQAAQKLARLQQLEQSAEYIQLREQTLAKLQQLEQHFTSLSQQLVHTPLCTDKNLTEAQTASKAVRRKQKKRRNFV